MCLVLFESTQIYMIERNLCMFRKTHQCLRRYSGPWHPYLLTRWRSQLFSRSSSSCLHLRVESRTTERHDVQHPVSFAVGRICLTKQRCLLITSNYVTQITLGTSWLEFYQFSSKDVSREVITDNRFRYLSC